MLLKNGSMGHSAKNSLDQSVVLSKEDLLLTKINNLYLFLK